MAAALKRTNTLGSAVFYTLTRSKKAAPKPLVDLGPQRRHLPAQAGSKSDRRDAGSLARLESESAETVIEAGLWRYHRLIPPPEDSKRYFRFQLMLEYYLQYTAFWMPLRVAFFSHLNSMPWIVIDSVSYFVDLCFWVDIGLVFRTAFYDHDNELVTDWNVIWQRYLEKWFWIDSVASFPWELVTGIFEVCLAVPSAPSSHPQACRSPCRFVRVRSLSSKLFGYSASSGSTRKSSRRLRRAS